MNIYITLRDINAIEERSSCGMESKMQHPENPRDGTTDPVCGTLFGCLRRLLLQHNVAQQGHNICIRRDLNITLAFLFHCITKQWMFY